MARPSMAPQGSSGSGGAVKARQLVGYISFFLSLHISLFLSLCLAFSVLMLSCGIIYKISTDTLRPIIKAHLHSQLAQLSSNLSDTENLLRMTAVQAEAMRGLGAWHGGM